MDKGSANYFMTKMTQEEYNEKIKNHKIIDNYEFNHIQPERSKREDSLEHEFVTIGCTDDIYSTK